MMKSNLNKSFGFRFKKQWPGYVCQLHGLGFEMHTDGYSWDGMNRFDQHLERYLFQYTISGKGHIRIGKKNYDLNSGDAFMVTTPGDYHYYLPSDSDQWELIFLSIRGNQLLKDIWNNIIHTKGPIIKLNQRAPIVQWMFHIHQLAANKLIHDEFFAAGLAYQFLMELHRLTLADYHYTHNDTPHWVQLVEQHLSNNIHRDISLDELLTITKMNKYHFIRSFQKATGKTPIQYLIRLRLQHAVRLLRQTDLTIHDIAKQCGFSSSNYFSRIFRSWIGVSPSDFRRSSDIHIDELYL